MLPKVNKILYSTDLSFASRESFAHALSIAKQYDAKIYILHLIEKLSADARFTLETYLLNSKSRHSILRDRIKNANDRLDDFLDEFWRQHSDYPELKKYIESIHIAEAYPAEAILRVSAIKEVDLIVMGTHEKGVKHRFLGSVARDVLGQTVLPVLMVPLHEGELTKK